MNSSLASLIYACGIAGLFYLDRDKSVRTSKALWLPVVYLWIIGSRPVSVWLGMGPPSGTDTQLEGSPIDAAVFAVLLVAAFAVLVYRGPQIIAFLSTNFPKPILLYFVFCLVSIVWSDYPGPALKKWTKSTLDVAMILIVVTDEQPVAALRRLFSRVGFILLPLSVLLIKYYPGVGRFYGVWDGAQMNVGMTLDKNLLGLITFVLSLGALWRVLALLSRDETTPDRRRHLLAQGTLLATGVWLLILANSATCLVCFVLGAGLMLATKLRFMRRHPAAVHALVLWLAVTAALVMLLGGGASAAQALGRNPTLTGRTDIWAAVIPLAANPLVGAGFESFWISPSVHRRLWELIPGLPLNEAHDGYLEVYLNLGLVGVGLIVLILIHGYGRAFKAFRREPALGGLLLAYVLAATTYNVTEAGFRMMDSCWIFFLLAVIEASNFTAGIGAGVSPPVSERVPDLPTRNALASKSHNVLVPRKITVLRHRGWLSRGAAQWR
jgi:exopolysaccharide production protein ExoQ